MIAAYRIVKEKYSKTAFDGEGASKFGGRWTSKGKRVVYTASTISLATLEMVVHFESASVFSSYCFFEVQIPKDVVSKLAPSLLPKNWRSYPAPALLKRLGDKWLGEGKTAVLEVPSAVVSSEMNFLLNPNHRDFHRIKIGAKKKYVFDNRISEFFTKKSDR